MRLPFSRTPHPPPAPDVPFAAIGDVHGRLDLLAALIHRIVRRDPELLLVLLGDMIDRGPETAAVLRLLYRWRHEGVVCLMGNHEEMLLRFIDDPVAGAAPWLCNGGRETLLSFDLPPPDPADPAALRATAEALSQALGPMLGWLRALPPIWRNGNVVAAHAGLDPRAPPQGQDRRHLLWGHPAFAGTARRDGLWVVHGHVVQDDPSAREGRIGLDTGAWATGRLTAARITRDGVEFVSTGPGSRPQALIRTGTPL